MAEQKDSQNKFVHITFPHQFVSSPFKSDPNEQGKTYNLAYVTMPKGVNVNGIDISGFQTKLFMSDRTIQQKLSGEPCTFAIRPDRDVSIWKNLEDGTHQSFKVKPWDLTVAVKRQREAYRSEREAERPEVGRDEVGKDDLDVDRAHGPESDRAPHIETDAVVVEDDAFEPESASDLMAAATMTAQCYDDERNARADAQGELML